MESNVKSPVWKMLAGYVLFIFLLIVIAMVWGCGSRKVRTDTTKSSDKEKVEQVDESLKTLESSDKSKEESSKNNDKVNEKTETTVVTRYDTSGKPLETRTTTKTSKTVDKSKMNNKKDTEAKKKSLEKLRVIRIHTKETVYQTKIKTIDVTNYALYWMLGVVGIVGVVALFLYFYIRKK